MTFQRIYSTANETSNAINAAADMECTHKMMASLYADCIRAEAIAMKNGREDRCDWLAINTAILSRWSRSGLVWIKRQAWKELEAIK